MAGGGGGGGVEWEYSLFSIWELMSQPVKNDIRNVIWNHTSDTFHTF